MFRYSRRILFVITLTLLVWVFIRRQPIFVDVTFRNDGLESGRTAHSNSLLSSGLAEDLGVRPQRQTSTTGEEIEKSIHVAILSFMKYGDAATQFLRRKRSNFEKLSLAHRSLADTIQYSQHFQTADHAVKINAGFAERVASNARNIYRFTLPTDVPEEANEYGDVLLPYTMTNDVFGLLIRDWSQELQTERDRMFPPVLDALELHFASLGGEKKILVPGFGLGRLAHEIAEKDKRM
jgi:N2227-like protein